ncbi:phosphoglycolate phosphatase [Arenimonas sp.]|uniref:phosphoglycolate phosphatase n=1 Tax=Arenimonas sp. TaxID=1872635 RepID=UPI0039E6BF3C
MSSATRFAPVILFDLDGTLVDSAVDLLNALNRVLAREGRLGLPLSAIRPVVSKGARAMLSVAFADLDESAREAFLQPFLDQYESAVADHSTPFDGVEELLATIEAQGARWGIVTNKPLYLARGVVASMGWSTRSAILLGGDSLPRKKPDPDQLFLACEELGVSPGDCIYVGDDERDIVAARRAGMKSVAALWGYREAHEDPAAWRPDAMAASPRDLLAPGLLVR